MAELLVRYHESPREYSDGSYEVDADGSYDFKIHYDGKVHWLRGAFCDVIHVKPMASNGCCELSKPEDQKQGHKHGCIGCLGIMYLVYRFM